MSKDDLKRFEVTRVDTGVMKAVAAAFMVWHHAFLQPERLNEWNGYDPLIILQSGQPLEYMLAFFFKVCVALFMLLSGYGICKYFSGKSGSLSFSEISSMIGKRVKGVFIKWWQVLAVFIPLAFIFNVDASNQTLMDWLKSALFIDFLPNKEVWFAPPYILMMCMVPFIMRWFDRKHANIWSDGILIVVINALALTGIPHLLDSFTFLEEFRATYFHGQMTMTLAMLPTFMTGWYLAKYNIIEKIRAYFDGNLVGKLVGIIIIYAAYLLRTGSYIGTRYSWDYFDFIYAAAVMIAVLLLLDGFNKLKEKIAFIGKQSTGIWMMHSFFCFYYFQDFIYDSRNPIIIFVLTFVCSFITSYAISEVSKFLWKNLKSIGAKEE